MQRKVFRIESMLTARRQRPGMAMHGRLANPPRPSASDHAETVLGLETELAVIHEAIAHNKRELAALLGDGTERRLARAGDELSSAVAAMRGATDTILGLAEAADDSARTLAATLTDEYKRGLTQDIQDQIVKVYETCNFQDIAGQHIGKVIALLAAMEEQLGAILARCGTMHAASQPLVVPEPGSSLLNGPKIRGDAGHATQNDIDRMFA